MRKILTVLLLSLVVGVHAQSTIALQRGWQALVKDDDVRAIELFWNELQRAKANHDLALQAECKLYLAMASYGSSTTKGLEHTLNALRDYKSLSTTQPKIARNGQGRSLQLLATIQARQGKTSESVQTSKRVLELIATTDSYGTRGLAMLNIGRSLERDHSRQALMFYRNALSDFKQSNQVAYLPGAYLKIAAFVQPTDQRVAQRYRDSAFAIADRTGNRQAMVSSLIAMGKADDYPSAQKRLTQALSIARSLTDKHFEITAVEALADLESRNGNPAAAVVWYQKRNELKDSLQSYESQQSARRLEIQYGLAEKEQALELAKWQNTALCFVLALVMVCAAAIFLVLRRARHKDRDLLATRAQLVQSLENEKMLREQQHRHAIGQKETQLSAVSLEVQRKNEFLETLRNPAGNGANLSAGELQKMVNQHLAQGYDWEDVDAYFDGFNQALYDRLRERFPSITANDLKLCALVRLNLSIKEMAGILNISPDSVKTARYRLRRKLGLSPNDNLTEFLLKQ